MDEVKHAPGKTILRIVSIVGLVIVLVGSCSTFASAYMEQQARTNVFPGWYNVWVSIALCVETYIYIMALIHCANLDKAATLHSLGKVLLVSTLISIVLGIALIGASAAFMIPISLAFPILYLVGASKNMNA